MVGRRGRGVYWTYGLPPQDLYKLSESIEDMATLTVTVPEDFKKDMEEQKLIDWEEVAREAIRLKIAQLRILNAIAAKSKLTEQDALELGRKVRAGIHERHVHKYGG